jgi:hypothetical protein
MPSTAPILDPEVRKFCLRVQAAAAAAPDAIAGLLLKLCARVANLEKVTKAQAVALDGLRKGGVPGLLPFDLPPPAALPEPAYPSRPRRAGSRKPAAPVPLRAPADDGSRWIVDRGFDEGVG